VRGDAGFFAGRFGWVLAREGHAELEVASGAEAFEAERGLVDLLCAVDDGQDGLASMSRWSMNARDGEPGLRCPGLLSRIGEELDGGAAK